VQASNLMILPEGVRRIPLDKILPYNENDLLMFISPDIALVIMSLMDDNKQVFSIKSLMMENQQVFACADFEKAVSEFSKDILKARLERYFETKKSEYIYFDKEEQLFLKNIFERNHLSGFIKICFKNSSGIFEAVNFEKISMAEYRKIKTDLRKMGIIYAITPERFIALKRAQAQTAQKKSNPFSFKEMMEKKEKEKINKVFVRFPEFEVRTKQSLKGAYRLLSKSYHPDVNSGDDKMFKILKEDYELLKKSTWYKNLPES